MDLEKIRELIAFAQEHDLVELEVREGDQTIRFRRSEPPVPTARLSTGATNAVPELNQRSASTQARRTSSDSAIALHGSVIKAPMAGTFYRAPAPGEPAFVEVGSVVEANTVVGIIESMKMMNPVEAGRSGTVGMIVVGNSERVQIDQPLMTVL